MLFLQKSSSIQCQALHPLPLFPVFSNYSLKFLFPSHSTVWCSPRSHIHIATDKFFPSQQEQPNFQEQLACISRYFQAPVPSTGKKFPYDHFENWREVSLALIWSWIWPPHTKQNSPSRRRPFCPIMFSFLWHQNQKDLNNFAFSHEVEAIELSVGVYCTSVTVWFYAFIVPAIQNQCKQHQFLSETIILSHLVCLEECLNFCHLCR